MDGHKITGPLEDAIRRSRRTFNKFRFIYELDSKPTSYEIDFYFTELRFAVELILRPCSQIFNEAAIVVNKDSNVDFSKARGIASSGKYDGLTAVRLTVETATQLAEPARYFLMRHMEMSEEEQNQSESVEIWRLPAAVVGITQAIEMCFKSACLALNIPYDDESHSLIDGYHLLPEIVRMQIKNEFEHRVKENEPGRSYAFIWSAGTINHQEVDEEIQSKVHGMSIDAILERTSDSFEDWRYCYEKSSSNGQKVLEIPLGAMVYLVDSAIVTATNVINRPSEFS